MKTANEILNVFDIFPTGRINVIFVLIWIQSNLFIKSSPSLPQTER